MKKKSNSKQTHICYYMLAIHNFHMHKKRDQRGKCINWYALSVLLYNILFCIQIFVWILNHIKIITKPKYNLWIN